MVKRKLTLTDNPCGVRHGCPMPVREILPAAGIGRFLAEHP